MDRQEHLYLAQKKASTPAPAKPAQTTKPAATVSAKQAPAKAVTAAPVTPKPAAKTSAPATSVAQSKTAATMANLTKQNQLLAAELKIAKKNEQAAQVTKAAAKKDPVPVKPAASGKGSTSVINKVATGAKNLGVGTYNLLVGDDIKAAFGKNSTTTERWIGSASLAFTVVTLGEGALIKGGIKAAAQGALSENPQHLVKLKFQVRKSHLLKELLKQVRDRVSLIHRELLRMRLRRLRVRVRLKECLRLFSLE
ncbi:hypothetical protein [Paenibacillus sp. MMS20-IR301]|uniref:hypothetical protein n=1 Tax=Paenibacillus sp. MMS20-IR301 TaxID=2895946 RepID=UPI0028E6BEC4|nr:hypothetical protein [Paenibacillus sp. MMS20-IR301]WNS43286.1 hypothetical protein LOS79_30845 [Paenibacillus sp. MMS20-IR301]